MLYDFSKPTDNLSKMSQRFCLRWNNHQSNLLSVFDQLFHAETFTDVTLAVEGQLLKAHKMVLSACSPYFQALFLNHPEKHPIVILKDVPYSDMKSLLDFMYRGEVSVDQERLTAFLRVAESLRIKGLTEVNEEKCDLPAITNSLMQQNMAPTLTPPPQLHRIHPYLTAQRKQQSHMLMNPLLGNALTQPKRKRGRPRKLSGSSNGTPGITSSPSESFRDEYDNRAKNSFIQGSPEMMEVKMGADGFGGSGGEGSEEPTTRDDDDIETLEGDAEDTEPMASTSKENSPRKGASADDNAGNCFLTQENDQNHSNVQPTITLELIRPEPTKPTTLRETRIQHQQSEKHTKTETTVELEPTSGIHFLTNDEHHQEPFLVPKLEQSGYDPEYSVGGMTAADADSCAPIKNKNELLEYLTRSDGSVVCKLCGEVLASRTHWYRHKYKFHVASSQQPAPLFKCEECHVFFKSRKGYIGHLSSRHSEPEAISPDPPTMEGLGAVKQEAVDHELAIPKSELPRPDRRVNRVLRGATSSGECAVSKGADWEQEQRDKEERLVADIIDRVRRECEAQGATVTRRGYSRRSTVMNT